MHAVAAEAVAGTVIGLSIRCVPRTKTDEAEGAFALVVSWLPSRPSVSALVSLMASHRIASSISSSHAIYHQPSRYQLFFQVKSSPNMHLYFYSFIHRHTHTRLSIIIVSTHHWTFLFCSHYVPHRPRYPPPSGLTTSYDTLFIIHFQDRAGTVWTGLERLQHFSPFSTTGSYLPSSSFLRTQRTLSE